MSTMADASGAELIEFVEFDCPRCGASAVRASFYGPCPACAVELRRSGLERGVVEVGEYAPKMNVTPNFIATKD